jgi:hydroxymethylpyrimidine kinase/phosphomethylpyrimidine kinase/thiamine-phosphate diphosphorylase
MLLSIAGHDPTGGAGLGTDLAAWQAMGLHGASVCTALTVQDRRGVHEVLPTPPATLRAALAAATQERAPAAVKLGMLGSDAVAAEVAGFCQQVDAPVVWDTVLGAAAGGDLLGASPATLRRLALASTVITPNRIEAARLLGVEPWQGDGAPPASWLRALREQWLGGPRTRAVVLKGGHADGARSVDWVCTRDALHALSVPRLADGPGGRVHGTGCLYASTLAGMLAQGADVLQAAVEAQWRTHAGIAGAWQGAGARAMVRAGAMPGSDSFPALSGDTLDDGLAGEAGEPCTFAALQRAPGLYPVLPDADWVIRLLELGVDTLQLRWKGSGDAERRAQVRAASDAARAHGAQLFINDHWRDALDAGAYGVHLGQQDLPGADLRALRDAGLRLGVSTHDLAELARAHALRPSYIALGPVWPTTLKSMPYAPLGLARLRDWAARCKPRYPVVGIGGISLERVAAAMDCGLDGVAVVGAVVGAADAAVALRRGRQIVDAALQHRQACAAARD